MAVIASAVIIGATTLGGAYLSSQASGRASRAATQAADQNNALQREIYDRNTANLTPFMERGNAAGERINNLLGLGGDPTAANRAFDQYRDSTGYQFMLDQGMQAQNRTAAAAGGLQSGAALKAGQRFGQQLGSTKFQEYLNNLYQQQSGGITGASAIAGVGQGFANATSANNNSRADAVGNAALSNAGNVNSLLGSLAQTGAYAFGNSAYGRGGGAFPSSSGTGIVDDWSGASAPY